MKNNKHIESFRKFNENLNISDVSDSFKIKAQKLIDDTRELKDEYSESQYKKIMDLEKLIDGTEDDRKRFVKSIMRLLGMTKWDLPNELYRYL
jgi:hypothetical protein